MTLNPSSGDAAAMTRPPELKTVVSTTNPCDLSLGVRLAS